MSGRGRVEGPASDPTAAAMGRGWRAASLQNETTDPTAALRTALEVADAAVAFDDAQRAYLTHLDRPDKPTEPDLSDPAVAAEWFGPWNIATEANRRFREAVASYRAALASQADDPSGPDALRKAAIEAVKVLDIMVERQTLTGATTARDWLRAALGGPDATD